MNAPDFRVRRATIEDLPALAALWQSMRLPANELERQLTEFQVAVDADGIVIGAVGFQIVGKNGLIHSEGFTDYGAADTLRPLLWERLQMLAANHGTVRAWTKETTPFWRQAGLAKPDADALAKLPPAWAALPGDWLALKLREDVEEILSTDKEFELFKQSAKRESEAALGQARVLKTIATVGAIILGIAVLIASVMLVLHKTPTSPH